MSVKGPEPIFSNNFYNPVFLQKDSTRQALKKVSMVAGAVLLASALAPCVLASVPLLAKITIMKSAGALGCFILARFIPKGKDHPDILQGRLNGEAVGAFENLAAFKRFMEAYSNLGSIEGFLNSDNCASYRRIQPIYQDYIASLEAIEQDQELSPEMKAARIPLAYRFHNQKLQTGAPQQ